MPAGAPRRGESSESIIRGALRPLHPRVQPFILCLNIRPPHCARVVKLHYSFFILHYSLKKDSHTNRPYKQTRAHGDVHRLRGGGTFKAAMRAIMPGSARR